MADFGQSVPPLSVYIRKVLERYPKEEILKELLQNAEDAGARELVLTLDCRSFGRERLLHPSLAASQGPALVASNDAPFSAADWENIQRTERSYKSEEWDQIGKFGIGFNAVYHLTDLPWIASGDTVGVFDPQEGGAFADRGRPLPGQKWSLAHHRQRMVGPLADQFAPFAGIANGKGLEGTEFRFPLRVGHSGLSDERWTPEKVETELFSAFLRRAPHLLLFLSSVATLRLQRWEAGAPKPTPIYTLTAKRSGLVGRQRESSFLRSSMVEEDGRSGETRRLAFAVQHRIHQGGQAELESLSKTLRAVPWVAVAADLSDDLGARDAGGTFCFLPLPTEEPANQTGLPVHVHGSFALTDSRRTLAHHHARDARSRWNRLLCEELLPSAYAELIRNLQSPPPSTGHIRPGEGQGRWANSLWPDLEAVKPFWRPTAAALLALPNNVFWAELTKSLEPLAKAFFLEETSSPSSAALVELCGLAKIPLVTEPAHLALSLTAAAPERPPTRLSPPVLSALLRRQPSLISGGRGDVGGPLKKAVLRFLLRDGDRGLLSRLRLLPTLADTFRVFHVSSETPEAASQTDIEEPVYLVSDPALRLLSGELGDIILDPELNEAMRLLAESSETQVVVQDASHIPSLLNRVLQATPPSATDSLMPKMWEYLNQEFGSLSPLKGLNLLPVRTRDGAAVLPLDPSCRPLRLSPEDSHHAEWLLGLGVVLLDPRLAPSHPDLHNYLASSQNPAQLLSALPGGPFPDAPAYRNADSASLDWLRVELARLDPETVADCAETLTDVPLFNELRPSHRLVSAKECVSGAVQAPHARLELPALLASVDWADPTAQLVEPACAALAGLLRLRIIPLRELLGRLLTPGSQSSEAALSWLFLHAQFLEQSEGCVPSEILESAAVGEYLRDFVMVRQGPETEADWARYASLVTCVVEMGDAFDWAGFSSVPIVLCDKGLFHLPYTILSTIPYARNVCPFLCRPHESLSAPFLAAASVRASLELQEKVGIIKHIWVERRSDRLEEGLLSFVLEVLEDVCRSLTPNTVVEDLDLFLPDASAVLRRVDELVVGAKGGSTGSFFRLHPKVYQEIAAAFGVRSGRDLELADVEADWGSDFGQEVDLVARITRLLHHYDGEQDLLQEFLQNADDAGASELVVAIDARRHGTGATFSESWAALQGPAVLLWNDAIFSEEDLAGIQRLGVGSKAEEAGKIGRFGAGFNCAYRLSDCPHFISNDDVLCIFDPLRRYIARNSRDRPGKRLNLPPDSHFRHTFKDSYDAMSGCGRPLRGGTAFRLPLRKTSSPLWPTIVSVEDMGAALTKSAQSVLRMLLFLNNVNKVSAWVIDESGVRQKLWSVESAVKETALTEDCVSFRQWRHFVSHAAKSRNLGSSYSAQVVKASHATLLTRTNELGVETKEDWLISQRLGFSQSHAKDFGEVKLLPVGGCARRLSGSEGPADMVFCSLPLPLRTNLPVTLQGHLCLDEARKTLSSSALSLGFLWNEALKGDVILGAYTDLLAQLAARARPSRPTSLGDFWDAFPKPDTVHSDWKPFVEDFYTAVVAGVALPTSPDEEDAFEWRPLDSLTYFPDREELAALLTRMGIRLVCLDPALFAPVRAALVAQGAAVLSPAIVAELLRNGDAVVANAGARLPCPLADTAFAHPSVLAGVPASPSRESSDAPVRLLCQLLDYLAQRPPHLTVNDRWALNLFGLPLRLTLDGALDIFQDAGVFQEPRDVGVLFPKSARRFLHPSLVEGLEDLRGKIASTDLLRLGFPDLLKLLGENLDPGFTASDDFCLPMTAVDAEWLWGLWRLLFRMFAGLKGESEGKELYLNRVKRAAASLARWKIVPVRQGDDDDGDLAPFSLSRFVFAPGTEEERVFAHLGVPVFFDSFRPNARRLSNLDGWFEFKHLLANEFSSGIKALAHWNDRKKIDWDSPSVSIRAVLNYIMNNANRIDSILSNLIARFPIFKTVEGVYTRMESAFPVYVFPDADQLGLAGRDKWTSGVVLLDRIPVFDQLYLRLGIPSITLPQAITQYLVPALPSMSVGDRVGQLLFLSGLHGNDAFDKTDVDRILSILKETAFVAGAEGERLHKVAHFHDHTARLFRSMLGPAAFLPPAFLQEAIPHTFYTALGLKTVPSPADYIAFARELEAEEPGDAPKAYVDRVQCLLESAREHAVFGGKPAEAYRPCLEELSRCRIIPRVMEKSKLLRLQLEGSKEVDTNERMAIRGSLKPGLEALVWTCECPLPAWLGDDAFLDIMGAVHAPSIPQVLAHATCLLPPLYKAKLGNESVTGLNSPAAIKLLQRVVSEITNFFHERLDEVGEFEDALRGLPFLLVEGGRRLAPPSMVVMRMPDFVQQQRIPPFLFELPHESHAFEELYRGVGVAELPDAAHFARTLELIDGLGGDASNPNVAEAVMMAQKGLVRSAGDEMGGWDSLSLLGSDYKLHPAASLVLRDKELGAAVQLPDLLWVHPDEELGKLKDLLRFLPEALRPKLLSQVVLDEVDFSASTPCEHSPCPVQGRLGKLLGSTQFKQGLELIFRHDAEAGVAEGAWEEDVARVLRTEVLCFEVLETRLTHRESGAALGEAGAVSDSHYSLASETLSVRHEAGAEGGRRSRFIQSLTRSLHAALSLSSFESALRLQELLDVSAAAEAVLLSALPAETRVRRVSGPQVGERLASTRDLLLSSLHFYSEGELVGYLVPSEDDSEICVILARVAALLDRRDEDSKAIHQRYRLMIQQHASGTPKTVEATALDLYKFASSSEHYLEDPDESESEEEEEEEPATQEEEMVEESPSSPPKAAEGSEKDSQLFSLDSLGSRGDLDGNGGIQVETESATSLPQSKESPGDSLLDSEEELKSLDSPRLPTTTPQPTPQKAPGTTVAIRTKRPGKAKLIERKPPKATAKDLRSEQEIKDAISREVEEAFKLSGPEKKKMIRRLLLQWHPDKNTERDSHAIFLHLKTELSRAESGAASGDWYEKWWAAWKSGGKFPSAAPPKAQPAPKPEFRKPTQRERPPWAPNDGLAARYWAQALHDRNAVKKAASDLDFGAEVVVFLAAQAVEKMLKAAVLKTKGTVDRFANLRHLVSLLLRFEAAGEELKTAVEEMIWRCDVDLGKLRYPDCLPAPAIPHDHYSIAQRRIALDKLNAVHAYLSQRYTF